MEKYDEILGVDILKEVDALTMWDILDDSHVEDDYYQELTADIGIE
ncbi:MAG: hypothetical protein ACK5MJ_08760 [Alphaproteobacteria bacterium]